MEVIEWDKMLPFIVFLWEHWDCFTSSNTQRSSFTEGRGSLDEWTREGGAVGASALLSP